MRGLTKIPSLKNLLSAYNEIQSNSVTEKNLIQFFQWVRFDPRLGEILVQKLLVDWEKLNPFHLHIELIRAEWPAVMGVLLDMVEMNAPQEKLQNFRSWKSCVLYRVGNPHYQHFFIGLTAFAGKRQKTHSDNSNKIFKKWNYYGAGVFINKERMQKINRSLISKEKRKLELEEFIKQQTKPFTVRDYMQALSHPISQRVAQLDLSNHPLLKCKGFTKNKTYYRF